MTMDKAKETHKRKKHTSSPASYVILQRIIPNNVPTSKRLHITVALAAALAASLCALCGMAAPLIRAKQKHLMPFHEVEFSFVFIGDKRKYFWAIKHA